MDLKVILAAFTAVFFAELADKTQLVGITIAAKSARPLSVWLGSVSAYIIVTAFSVLAGALLAKFIRPELMRYIGATLFIAIGILMFLGKI
ncbi:MAG: TMEM165/GDT1 family protein [Candidatus Omnitrophica bacterium]|nr:TMEM165/GDT1 family protein [Candidatus Omnitrophota bacterium]MDD5592424.1 TMEM165/GDT1 family protein [Candidatus Omnitrophota bacterium]